jgi:hypothetical protein
VKSEGNSNDHRDRTRALHASTPDSVRGISPGHEGSRPTATRFLLVQQREERLPLLPLWVSVHSAGRTRRRTEGPAEWRRLQRAYQPVSQAYVWMRWRRTATSSSSGWQDTTVGNPRLSQLVVVERGICSSGNRLGFLVLQMYSRIRWS